MSTLATPTPEDLAAKHPEVLATGKEPPAGRRRTRLLWLLAGIIVAVVAAVGVWALIAAQTSDELTGAAASDHDSWVAPLLEEQAAGSAQLSTYDPWVQARLRERTAESSVLGEHDPWVQARVRGRGSLE